MNKIKKLELGYKGQLVYKDISLCVKKDISYPLTATPSSFSTLIK